jgi:hypothetical protein
MPSADRLRRERSLENRTISGSCLPKVFYLLDVERLEVTSLESDERVVSSLIAAHVGSIHDFMFQLDVTEFANWKSQIVTSNPAP